MEVFFAATGTSEQYKAIQGNETLPSNEILVFTFRSYESTVKIACGTVVVG